MVNTVMRERMAVYIKCYKFYKMFTKVVLIEDDKFLCCVVIGSQVAILISKFGLARPIHKVSIVTYSPVIFFGGFMTT